MRLPIVATGLHAVSGNDLARGVAIGLASYVLEHQTRYVRGLKAHERVELSG